MVESCRLLVESGVHPSPSATDLLSLAWGPESGFRSFNPFLSDKACGQLRVGVLVWLQLCVLEDRLERVMSLAGAGDKYMPLLIRVRSRLPNIRSSRAGVCPCRHALVVVCSRKHSMSILLCFVKLLT
jgi:hypothetical protein